MIERIFLKRLSPIKKENKITLTSKTNNPDDVTLVSSLGGNYHVLLKGVSHVEFRHLTFKVPFDQIEVGRVVVLRKADQKNNFIQYHSDIRSTKIEKIKKNSNCSILFYGKEEKIQLRIKVNCEVNYNNQVTKESWEKTGHISRKCYLVTKGPGTESNIPTSGLNTKFDNFDFTKEQSEKGYKNFSVIKCEIKSIEWLYLAAKGHRRALIDMGIPKKFTWLIP